MSHSKERVEKICLNCNAELFGKYCHVCGQENREPKETVWSLVSHFFYDITHFDGKFFTTLGTLIRRPGFLSSEYVAGRRASYLNPIRMYVFTSAVFFIIFYSIFDVDVIESKTMGNRVIQQPIKIELYRERDLALKSAENKEDSARIYEQFSALEAVPFFTDSSQSDERIFNLSVHSKSEYDSVQSTLPADKRHSWLKKNLMYRAIYINDRFGDNKRELFKDVLDKFIHTFPYLLFISLPLYALFLKLLYIRRRQFYYTDHGIFLIHLYIFTFILLLVLFGLTEISESFNANWPYFVQGILLIYGVGYTIRAMRNFYRQGWLKTFIKFILFNVLAFISITFLFVLFFFVSILRI